MKTRGIVTVEFSLIALVFFTLLYVVMEVARAMYLLNTLQEVTRRAAAMAAVSDFSSASVMSQVRQSALLRTGPGTLTMGQPVSDAHVQIDYLALTRAGNGALTLTPIPTASLPACVARARLNCIADPNGASCIRFVRARVCTPNGNGGCDALAYQTMVPLFSVAGALPVATTIAKAESLGLLPGSPLCP
ncbi:TadE family protein [Duganella sp. HH105]|uniref:TadE family protein n=1 Tax=Duganella sp. HH105 TaxID=1781067 RepID=UPI000877BE36|nr:TadE family protein [Duganella sp. HH105]OEZ63175.1 TadE-like protein [Duganella sp. HH105]